MENLNKITTLFIDFDNTIVSYNESEYLALEKLGKQYNIENLEEMIAVYKKKNHELWSLFEEKKITIPQIVESRFAYMKSLYPQFISEPLLLNDEYLDNFVDSTNLEQSVLQNLRELKKQGFKLVIVSNGIHNIQKRRMERNGMFDIIDDFITSEEAGAPKPAPNMFQLAIEKIEKKTGESISKDEILMIGDNYNADIKGAENFGIKTSWITAKNDKDHPFSFPHFNDFADRILENGKL